MNDQICKACLQLVCVWHCFRSMLMILSIHLLDRLHLLLFLLILLSIAIVIFISNKIPDIKSFKMSLVAFFTITRSTFGVWRVFACCLWHYILCDIWYVPFIFVMIFLILLLKRFYSSVDFVICWDVICNHKFNYSKTVKTEMKTFRLQCRTMGNNRIVSWYVGQLTSASLAAT